MGQKEYHGLAYILRGNPNPHGRSKIFYLCHKQERENYFQEICEDIFASQGSAVIWYPTDESGDLETQEYFDDLQEMNLIVAVITRKFLDAVAAGELKEYHFAKQHKIPILPLIQEPGLIEDYNRICGEHQTLYKASPFDPTEIPYEQKLKDYLETILFPNELAKEMKEAFDACIFLSYRKKDRYFAQDTMKKIHQTDELRKIAIWYDEYLVPGENFNDSIKEALSKAELFALVITPNIVNEENYVKNVEYPMAYELNKIIIPIEEVPTDRQDLEKKYRDIPKIRSAKDESELASHLSELLAGLQPKEQKDHAKQSYLLGLSYQLGLDVEKDPEYAKKMLEKAMEEGSEDAYRHVVGMYRYGHYVKQDLDKSKVLQQKLLFLLEERKSLLRQSGDAYAYLKALQHLFTGWFVLSDIEREMGHIDHIEAYLSQMLSVSEEISRCIRVDIPKALERDTEDGAGKYQYVKIFLEPMNYRNRIRCLFIKLKTANTPEEGIETALQAGKLSEEYYDFLVELKEGTSNLIAMMPDHDSRELDKALEEAKTLILGAQGSAVSIAAAAKQLGRARELLDAFYHLLEKKFPTNLSVESRLAIAALCNEMGDLENEIGDAENAYQNYLFSEDLLIQVNEEKPTLESLRYHYFVCKNLCMFLFECEGDWVKDTGKKYAVKAVSLMEQVLREKKTNNHLWDYGMALLFAAAFAKLQRRFEETDDYLMRATQVIEESGEDDSFIEDFMDAVAPDEFDDDGYIAPKKSDT